MTWAEGSIPNPEGSPLEKFELPAKETTLGSIQATLRRRGVPGELVKPLSEVIADREQAQHRQLMKNFKELEVWGNTHTHGEDDGDDPPDTRGNLAITVNPGGGDSWGLTWEGVCLRHSETADDAIYRIFVDSDSVVSSIPSPAGSPTGLGWDGTDLWNTDSNSNTVYRLDHSNGTVLQQFAAPSGSRPFGLTHDGTDVWLADGDNDIIYRLSTADGTVLQQFASPDTRPEGLGWDGFHLWVSCKTSAASNSEIYRLDPADGTPLYQFSAGFRARGLTYDGDLLWIMDGTNNKIKGYL